jgi:uncharacterized protein YlxW (UPF0749 family)
LPKPASRQLASAQLLIDIVTNPLDPGYAEAARRRDPEAVPRWYDRPAVAVGCLLIGFVLVVAYLQTHRSAPETTKVHDSLVTRVRSAEQRDTQLTRQLDGLGEQVMTARNRVLSTAPGLLDDLATQELIAGETPVTGPGLEVVLADPHGSAPPSGAATDSARPTTSPHILSDRDIQSVVNQLWADGAEAISVNGLRLAPTSAIRFAGQAVLVDLQPITSPYTIRAIGNADALDTGFAASPVAGRYQTLVSADGIQFSFTTHSSMTLQANPPAALRYAHPLLQPHHRGGR